MRRYEEKHVREKTTAQAIGALFYPIGIPVASESAAYVPAIAPRNVFYGMPVGWAGELVQACANKTRLDALLDAYKLVDDACYSAQLRFGWNDARTKQLERVMKTLIDKIEIQYEFQLAENQ